MSRLYLVIEVFWDGTSIVVGIFKNKKKAEVWCRECNKLYVNKYFVREIATDIFDKGGIE